MCLLFSDKYNNVLEIIHKRLIFISSKKITYEEHLRISRTSKIITCESIVVFSSQENTNVRCDRVYRANERKKKRTIGIRYMQLSLDLERFTTDCHGSGLNDLNLHRQRISL